jgi:large subunit ribosomal protein L25
MSNKIMLNATKREDLGKGASRRLRRSGFVPAIAYGGKETPVSITLEQREIQKEMKSESFYSQILTVMLDGKQQQFILKNLQRHPYKPLIMHMDLERVDQGKIITVKLPIHYLNETTAKGVKIGGGVVSHNLVDIEVNCLPANLPEYIEVDLANVELDQTLHLSDIKLPEGVESTALSHDDNKAVVSIHIPKAASAEDDSIDASADSDNKDAE